MLLRLFFPSSAVWWYLALCVVLGCVSFSAHVGRAHAATSTVVYESDFSSDPEWITDQPEHFYWDSAQGAFFARTRNQPEAYRPSRYAYIETTLNPKISYELSWDMKILTVEGGNTSGVAVFGLYGDKLHSFNEFDLNFIGNNQDGTFSYRLMTLDGSSRFVWTDVNPGYNYDITEVDTNHSFSIGVWYRVVERYDALTHQYHFQMFDRGSNQLEFERVIVADPAEAVNPELQNLGISMYPEGNSSTNLGQDSRIDGFAEYLIDNVSLVQIHDETYTEPSSVLFLPGIQSSRLYRDGLLGEDRVWEPNYNGDVEQLAMSEGGESMEHIYTRDVIDSALGFLDIYNGFEDFLMTEKAAGRISDYHLFAYDWRYSADDIVALGTQYEHERRFLVDTVQELANHNNSHVTVVAHSNGGFLAKLLISELKAQGLDHLIDKVIMVGSPQLGTPKVIASMLHGYDQEQLGGLLIDDETARHVIRNMPGAYGLVPSAEYVAHTEGPIIVFETASATQHFVDVYGETIDTFEELQNFMADHGDTRPDAATISEASDVRADLLAEASTLHQDMLDVWMAPEHIDVVEVVGVGLDTMQGILYRQFASQSCVSAGPGGVVCDQDVYYEPVPVFTRYGDETVIARSASSYPGNKQVYYLNIEQGRVSFPDLKHSNILELPELQQLLAGLFQNQNSAVPFFSTVMPSFSGARDVLSVHSPVALFARDGEGRFVGIEGDGEAKRVVTDIPGSSYREFGGGKYIIVPSSASYEVIIEGVGEEGSYTLAIDTLAADDTTTPVAAFMATATPDMEASLVKGGGIFGDLQVDYMGDGVVDETYAVAPEATATELFDALRTLFSSLAKLKESERSWLINNASKAEQTGVRKGFGSSGVLRIFASIDSKLLQYREQGRVSSIEYVSAKGTMDEIVTR